MALLTHGSAHQPGMVSKTGVVTVHRRHSWHRGHAGSNVLLDRMQKRCSVQQGAVTRTVISCSLRCCPLTLKSAGAPIFWPCGMHILPTHAVAGRIKMVLIRVYPFHCVSRGAPQASRGKTRTIAAACPQRHTKIAIVIPVSPLCAAARTACYPPRHPKH